MRKILVLLLMAPKVALGSFIKRFAFLAVAITLSSTASAATIYCNTPISSTSNTGLYSFPGLYSLNYSCNNLSGTSYRMILNFQNTVTITVTVTCGNGTYVYTSDDGALLASNVFQNVALGQHTVTVTKGRTNLLPATLNITGFQKYFKPNGVVIPDTLKTVGLENQPTAKALKANFSLKRLKLIINYELLIIGD